MTDALIARNEKATIYSAGAGRLGITGVLDFFSVPNIWQQSLQLIAAQAVIEIDLSTVTHCSSAGIALLIEWLRYAKRHNKTIHFSGIPAQTLSIAAATGLAQLLSCKNAF